MKMLDFIANIIASIASSGAGVVSTFTSYQPKTPSSLIEKKD